MLISVALDPSGHHQLACQLPEACRSCRHTNSQGRDEAHRVCRQAEAKEEAPGSNQALRRKGARSHTPLRIPQHCRGSCNRRAGMQSRLHILDQSDWSFLSEARRRFPVSLYHLRARAHTRQERGGAQGAHLRGGIWMAIRDCRACCNSGECFGPPLSMQLNLGVGTGSIRATSVRLKVALRKAV
jgi:hypothetical protein